MSETETGLYSGPGPRRHRLPDREQKQVHNNYVPDKRFSKARDISVTDWWRPWLIAGGVVVLIIVGLIITSLGSNAP